MIGDYAFHGCSSLSSEMIPATTPEVGLADDVPMEDALKLQTLAL
jgi:hypothetical protein